VLPDVEAEHGHLLLHDRAVLVRRALDRQSIAVGDDPCPAAAESPDGRLREFFFELVETTKRSRDRVAKGAAGRQAADAAQQVLVLLLSDSAQGKRGASYS
jgi:hypothetical protein